MTAPIKSHFLINLTSSLTIQAIAFLGRIWKVLRAIPWQLYQLTQKVDSRALSHFNSLNAEALTSPPP